jgi:hypothetical protein
LNRIKNVTWIVVVIAIVGILIYKIVRNSFTNSLLGQNPQRTKAVIINEKNYLGNQPVHPEFSYSYEFIINGERYTGNSHDISLSIGDTVDVVYNKDIPSINKPLHPKE